VFRGHLSKRAVCQTVVVVSLPERVVHCACPAGRARYGVISSPSEPQWVVQVTCRDHKTNLQRFMHDAALTSPSSTLLGRDPLQDRGRVTDSSAARTSPRRGVAPQRRLPCVAALLPHTRVEAASVRARASPPMHTMTKTETPSVRAAIRPRVRPTHTLKTQDRLDASARDDSLGILAAPRPIRIARGRTASASCSASPTHLLRLCRDDSEGGGSRHRLQRRNVRRAAVTRHGATQRSTVYFQSAFNTRRPAQMTMAHAPTTAATLSPRLT